MMASPAGCIIMSAICPCFSIGVYALILDFTAFQVM